MTDEVLRKDDAMDRYDAWLRSFGKTCVWGTVVQPRPKVDLSGHFRRLIEDIELDRIRADMCAHQRASVLGWEMTI
jgi:hypothetical protein